MSKKIEYTYTLKSDYCSDLRLVPKTELGHSSEYMKDIYNVYAIGDTDKSGVNFLRLRTRYYWTSQTNKEDFLHCFFETHLYITPNPSIIATEIKFVEKVLLEHDKFAFDCLSTKKLSKGEFPGFEESIDIRKLDINKHAQVIQKWMIDANK